MSNPTIPDPNFPWHAAAWQRLAAGAERGQIAHALLIHGEGGLHKLQLGRQIGQGLLCEAPRSARACGHCRGCLLYLAGNHPDWVEVHPVDSAVIKIDQIRELSSRLSMRPQIAQRQVALVWPAEQMNSAAANALLKTLEEPAADTHLLLLADRIGRLPATIRSRCQRLPLVAHDDAATVDAVAAIAAADAVRSRVALALAGGDPEMAIANLRPGIFGELSTLTQRLIDLARGALDPTAFAMVGKGEGALLLQRWSRLIALAVRGERLGSEPFDAWIDLTSRVEMSTLLPLATQLERARGLAGSGVREDLLIQDLAARWSQAFNHGERKHRA
jgi:DNA polymerase-3 subunit delta'